LSWAISQIKPNNAKKEYYLTDALAGIIQSGKKAIAITAVPPEDVLSINSRHQLAEVSKLMQTRVQEELMCKGVTIVDPSNTWIDARANIGQDTVIQPFTYIHGKVKIGRNCRIGPFAYVREGTVLEDDVVLGVFIEVKNAKFGEGTRARHHSYIGDAEVGRNVNIGAGTIFSNYDGKDIQETHVGNDSFIGSGAVLIAPLHIQNKGHVEPGSVVSHNGTKLLNDNQTGDDQAKSSQKRGTSKKA
jgi:bifunctional UDP-N-acetylglucosamine pyrophosphorylase/glucosamine-1-phosphate N-acetyltransferase